MKTRTKIEKQLKKKTDNKLIKTIILAKKNKNWEEIAKILSGPRKNRKNRNLEEINKESKDNEKIIIPGKVLSQGEIDKKIKIIALNFSKKAEEKLLKSKKGISSIIDEIKLNPEAKGIKILR